MTHIIIVGQGLAGLFAANVAASRGLQVTLVAQGRGGLSLSHGCLDLGRTPLRPFPDQSLSSALAIFLDLAASRGLRFTGEDGAALRLPTAAGTMRATQYAPESLARGDLQEARPAWIANLAGFRDFDAGVVVRGLRDSGLEAQAVTLPLPSPAARDL
ncbi:MAG TPA: FAD-binding protein, partial [Anaerolineales bacterium]|nr:FAD-binding protein [Anaerolineales bacterium]